MSNLEVRRTGPGYGDARSWVASDISEQRGRLTVTLDMSKFTPAVQSPNGYLQAGTVLGKITATGLYGPYDPAASDGRETAQGFLWDSFSATGTKEAAPLWVGPGVIQENKLKPGHGLDAAAKVDLTAWFKFSGATGI